ncbi:MAG: sorbosone dehydrogenase [Gemmatimonadetes bacterium]|nr:PQQ-dependent sugar dehydrogenase [Gemmatimonadota bacterium]NNM05784.1 sorbosone dehydrogenase [Gemmatimonadota bacterium]
MNRQPRRLIRSFLATLPVAAVLTGCQGESFATPQSACDPDNGSITLPEGFCAVVVSDSVGRARHIDVSPTGDVLLALNNDRGPDRSVIPGGVAVLRDTDGDGRANEVHRFGDNGGNEVLLDGEYLYFATDDAVFRYPFPEGSTGPAGPPDTIVSGLPNEANHRAKSLAIGPNASLFVNIGSPSNACQEQPRAVGAPGLDPCPQLETRAGIWRFDAEVSGQTQRDGQRFATGLRNTVALRTDPSGGLFGVIHGRDQLSALWGDLYTHEESAEKPAEEFVRIEEGDDFGWPYCYYDPATDTKVLAPEYGGDGTVTGRCAQMAEPLIDFPAHWAPNDLEFYTGTQFPEEYRGGAFVAFHGSWNRAPAPQGGYNVVFAPFAGGSPTGAWEIFANGFAGQDVSPRGADHRPVGLAVGPDGSLFISDSQVGKVWKVMYEGQ